VFEVNLNTYKVAAFVYGFSKEQNAIETRKTHSWEAPKLFSVQDELKTMNFFWCMAKQHYTTLRFVACSMGKLANVIWNKNWDTNYFLDNSTKLSFAKLIHDMYEMNLKSQKIV
jgi:hypothetical protein